jgi:hypothetical protein
MSRSRRRSNKSLSSLTVGVVVVAGLCVTPAGVPTTLPWASKTALVHAATGGEILLTLFPVQIELMRAAQGRTYRLEKALREPLMIRNMSEQAVEVELKALSLKEAGLRPEAGCADLLGFGKVSLSPASFSLGPGEERVVAGTLSLVRHGPKGKALMGVIAATVVQHRTKTPIYTRIYVHTR